jgi:hypothetical protein
MLQRFRLAILLPLFLIAGCNSNTTFKTFTSSEGGFSVEIPVLPTEKTSQAESPYGTLVERDYFSIYDNVSYTVGFIKLPVELQNELRKNPQQFENLDIGGLVSHSKGRLLGERGVHADGHSNRGKEVLISLPDEKHNLVSRVFLAGKTLYLIHTIIPKEPSYNQGLYSSRFLNSLRITNPE